VSYRQQAKRAKFAAQGKWRRLKRLKIRAILMLTRELVMDSMPVQPTR
jgi:hypothetical protein